MHPLNIVYIHSHDVGRTISPYGYGVPTPTFQALAEEGVLFRQAFAAGPTCSPSRTALLTGQNPHSAGMVGLAHRGFRLNDYSRHIAHTLRKAGYHSALVGMQHIAAKPEMIGYDQLYRPKKDADVAPNAVDFLLGEPKQPFFLDVGFFECHRQYPQVDPSATRYVRPPVPIPDTPETRMDTARFIASLQQLDAGVGRVLAALDEAGLRDNTLVICTTDHGIAFPGMKCNLTDHGTGVMLIIRGPEPWRGGRVIDAMVSHLDLYPTLCEAAGVEKPEWLEGRSLLPLVKGETDRLHDELFSEVTYHAAYEPQRAVRTSRWKYIRRFDDRTQTVLPNVDNGETKRLLLEHDLLNRPRPREMLYDLLYDPNEACNRIDDPALAEVARELRGRLDAWMRRTNDPLLNGFVPLPPGAFATPPEVINPNDIVVGQWGVEPGMKPA